MSIKFDGKKAIDLTEDDLDRVMTEEGNELSRYCHCLIIDPNGESILAAHYSKGSAGVIVQDTKRKELIIHMDAHGSKKGSHPDLMVTMSKTESGIAILSVADTLHKFVLSLSDTVLYANIVEKSVRLGSRKP